MTETLALDDVLTDYGRLPCHVCKNVEICETPVGAEYACNDYVYYIIYGAYRHLDRMPQRGLGRLIFSTDDHVQARV